MVVATLLSIISPLIENSIFNVSDVLDTFCHLLSMIFGILLYKTNEVEINKHTFKLSLIFIYSIVLIIIFINLVFKTSFFGLTFYGKPNIYSIHITDSPILNIIIYCSGLFIILLSTYFLYKYLDNKKKPNPIN